MNRESNYKQIEEEAQKRGSKSKVESETTNFKVKSSDSFKRLLRYSFQYKWLLVVGNGSLIITSLSMVALPYLTGKMIDAIRESGDSQVLNSLTYLFILLTIITCVFTFFRAYAYNMLGERITLTLRNDLFLKLVEKDIEFFDQNRSGELISRLSSDISVINKGANDQISMLLKNAIQFLGCLVLLWMISWQLTLVLFGVIPPFTILVIYFVKKYKKFTKDYQKAVAESTQVASEVLGNMRVVRSFSTEQKEALSFKDATLKAYDIGNKIAVLGSTFMSIGIFLGYGVVLAILYYGGTLVIEEELTIGELSSFVLYTITMTFSLLAVSGTMNTMISAAAVAEKIFTLMDHPIKVQNGTQSADYVEGEISLRNVTFAYPTKTTVTTLKSVNLDIKKGEVVAFVGQSGSGKSTIVSLLQRFYDVNEGEILIDGTKISQYDLTQLHKTIGFVSQEPTLFSGTLKENITYGVDQFTTEDLENAMKLANAYDFVQNKEIFPDGLETIVGERGVKLSGGQKQRIAIARALIKNPKILIFDEATSALDSESEFQVQTAIDGLVQSGQKTIIIIAHRLSTIINSNKIIVIQNGEIVEQGSHQQLIEKAGVYKALIERQLT